MGRYGLVLLLDNSFNVTIVFGFFPPTHFLHYFFFFERLKIMVFFPSFLAVFELAVDQLKPPFWPSLALFTKLTKF